MKLNYNKIILVVYLIGFILVIVDTFFKVNYNNELGLLKVGTVLTILCPILLVVNNYKKIAKFFKD